MKTAAKIWLALYGVSLIGFVAYEVIKAGGIWSVFFPLVAIFTIASVINVLSEDAS